MRAPEENQPKRRVLAKFTMRSTLGGGYGLVGEGGRLARTADSALHETFLTSADAMRSSQSRSEECKLGEKWGRGEGRQKGVESWRIVHPLIFATSFMRALWMTIMKDSRQGRHQLCIADEL